MNILYCGDENIADGLMISVLSLLRHVNEPLHIYIMTAELPDAIKPIHALPTHIAAAIDQRVHQYYPDSFARLIDATELFSAAPPTANMATRFTPCCMLRLYADLLPELPSRLLYLDNDVVCCQNPAELYHTELNRAELAGVPDHYGRWFFRRKLFGLDYINSGVLLLDMDNIRKTGLFEKCRQRCRDRKMFMPDQSAINKLAVQKLLLPRRYNEQRKDHPDTVMRHFTTSFRFFPWLHTVSVKPWHIEQMHTVLKTHKYDRLLEEYSLWKIQVKENV